jgi:hypothetical protein
VPHIDFNYPGLDEAYRVFSQKHARLLKVREKLEQPLADHVRQTEESLRAQRTAQDPEDFQPYSLSGTETACGDLDMLELLDQDREWNRRVLQTVREMALAYMVAMLDAFLGRWREENGLPGLPASHDPEGRWWYPATPEHINKTLRDLREQTHNIPPLALRPDVVARLTTLREQRNAVIHRDSEGVEDITGKDLDAALLTVNSIARALAFVTHVPLPHDRDGHERDSFISESLAQA